MLKKWNKDVFGQVDDKIKTLETQLCSIQGQISHLAGFGDQLANLVNCERQIRDELNLWYHRQEIHWAQKA